MNDTQGLDPGLDGEQEIANINRLFGADRTMYALGYHNADYAPIGPVTLTPGLSGETPELFNGNISWMSTDNSMGLRGSAYKYDALHRIKKGISYNYSGTWGADRMYDTEYSYDANGNLKKLQRHYQGNMVHDITYNYDDNKPNQLNHLLQPIVLEEGMTLPSQSANNYTYDDIGNMIGDDSSDINNIDWSVYGKINSVDNVDDIKDVAYTYDAQQNRLSKDVADTKSIYIRDASGNVMSIYQQSEIGEIQIETPIYGSSRIGIAKPSRLTGRAGV